MVYSFSPFLKRLSITFGQFAVFVAIFVFFVIFVVENPRCSRHRSTKSEVAHESNAHFKKKSV